MNHYKVTRNGVDDFADAADPLEAIAKVNDKNSSWPSSTGVVVCQKIGSDWVQVLPAP